MSGRSITAHYAKTQTVMVCGVETRSDNQSRPGTISGKTHRMNATTVELEAGHLSLVSHPKEIADLILAAAGRQK
jgi:hypothetical protein